MNWIQLRTLLWLRWRLSCNQWRRGGQWNLVISAIALTGGLMLAVLGCLGGALAGALGLSQASPEASLYVWDALTAAFLFFWTIGLVTELQRSEAIDLTRLLHLPVSLRGVFFLNYLASHLSLSLILMLPAMLGLAVGLLLGRGPVMLLLLPLVLGFFFMITAWTYCLRGWLAALMVNKRRRRAIVMGITMAFVLLSQMPNLLSNVFFHNRRDVLPPNPSPQQVQEWMDRRVNEDRRMRTTLQQAHYFVPFLWLPLGARGLMDQDPWLAVLGASGMTAIGAWGLTRAYRATLRFYQGGETRKSAARPAAVPPDAAGKTILVERILPGVPEEAGALALATLRSLSRAPEVKLALATNVLIFVFLGASVFLRHAQSPPDWARSLIASAAVAVTFMGVVQLMFNQFGFDRSGFRSFVLLPATRRHILLGKNLAMLPLALATFAVYLALVTGLARLGLLDVLAAGVEFAAAFLLMSVLGNVASILVPYRISAGSLKPTKMSGVTQLLIFVTHLLFPLAMAPIFLPAVLGLLAAQLEWAPGALVALLGALPMAGLAALLYWQTLEPLGRLLQRRERTILEVVTREVE